MNPFLTKDCQNFIHLFLCTQDHPSQIFKDLGQKLSREGKLLPEHDNERVWESEGIASLILNLGARYR